MSRVVQLRVSKLSRARRRRLYVHYDTGDGSERDRPPRPEEQDMPMQVITFKLNGIDDAAYQSHAEQTAPMFAALPGLRMKIWVANQQTNTYGGIYTWDDVAAMRAYQRGTIFRGLLGNPHMTDVTVSDFSVLAGPTKLTRGGC